MFSVENISYQYQGNEGEIFALHDVSLHISTGQWWAIVGSNGSGKSTLARHLNGLLLPSAGRVLTAGLDTSEPQNLPVIHRQVGFVFQNPDNQMVGNTVEEDVAFGPENMGMPREEIRQRITNALAAVGLSGMEKKDPVRLSGGQKQRLAIAGALAMEPKALILDEATAMLDGTGRHDILALLQSFHQQGMTIVTITHDMTEVLAAQYIAVMEAGCLLATGTPRQIFSEMQKHPQWNIELPEINRIGGMLADQGWDNSFREVLTLEEMVEKLWP